MRDFVYVCKVPHLVWLITLNTDDLLYNGLILTTSKQMYMD